MKLIMGVNTATYYDPKGLDGQQDSTVQEVAQGIEKKYRVMETFVRMNPRMIGDAVASMIAARWSTGKDIIEEPIDQIINEFRKSLEGRKFDGTARGIPTEAARIGRKWRANSPSRGANRPSFIDTETYKNSFTSVLDE